MHIWLPVLYATHCISWVYPNKLPKRVLSYYSSWLMSIPVTCFFNARNLGFIPYYWLLIYDKILLFFCLILNEIHLSPHFYCVMHIFSISLKDCSNSLNHVSFLFHLSPAHPPCLVAETMLCFSTISPFWAHKYVDWGQSSHSWSMECGQKWY